LELAELVDQLTRRDDGAVAVLIQQEKIGPELLWSLKQYSARFYVTQPSESLRAAQATMRLSTFLRAPALGRWTLANALVYLERYAEAAQLFAQAREELLAAGDELDAARMAVGHVFVLAYTGQSQQALELAGRIEPVLSAAALEVAEDKVRLGNLLLNMGVALELAARFEESLSIYERLELLAAELESPLLLAQAQHNLAYAKAQLNLFDEALDAYARAEQIFAEQAAHVDLARLYSNRMRLMAAMQRPDGVERAYRQAEAQLTHLDDRASQQQSLALIHGLALLQMGQLAGDRLAVALEEARAAFHARGSRVEEGQACYVLGRLHLAQAEPGAARAAFEQAQTLAQEDQDRTLAYRSRFGLALLAAAEDNPPLAIDLLWQAVHEVEATRREIGADILRSGFLRDKLAIYQELAALLALQGRPAEAFAVVERAKERLITEKLAFRLQVAAEQLASTEEEMEVRLLVEELNRRLEELEQCYRQAQSEVLASGQLVAAPMPATAGAVARLERDVQASVRRIQRRRPAFLTWEQSEPLAVQQVQQTLGGAAFIQYTQYRDTIQAYVVGRDALAGPVVLSSMPSTGKVLQRFRTAVERALALAVQTGPERFQRYVPGLLADVDQLLAELYGMLLAPLAPYLRPGQPLIVAPDDLLYYVPFHALRDATGYLVEHRTVSYAPNATVRAMSLRHRQAPRRALLVGHDATGTLPHVVEEIEALHALLGAGCGVAADVALGDNATAERVRRAGRGYDILHLAAHAHFRADDPMLSAIVLADRPLTMAEMAVTDLDAELVALSGCETGRGDMHGADVLSLASSFLRAGARSLLVAQWRSDDAVTSRIMQRFYAGWLGGASRADALRQAQLHELRHAAAEAGNRHLQHPAFWAPFVLIGE
jgi:CHAT domain-containing protein